MSEPRFTNRRVIVVRHRGNVANKAIQYLGALTIASRIRNCDVVNVSIPEFGIEIPDDTQDQLFFDNIDLWEWDPFIPNVNALAERANSSSSIRIMMADHLQRMEFLLDRHAYLDKLPAVSADNHVVHDGQLLVNIRAAEILQGFGHYPLIPVGFYRDIVARTGLEPVFLGQLDDCDYIRGLKSEFPDARFIGSRGAKADFDAIRSARNIVVAISTFSWLAAWLSDAEQIVMPMSGFYNPMHHREIDLLPTEDIRYRYYLFPLNYGLPEVQALPHHKRMRGLWKEVSANQVNLIKTSAPFLRPPRENHFNGFPDRAARSPKITFDPVWYAHEYLDAAMEISEGWFEDPMHHYLEVGRLRGYQPTAELTRKAATDLRLQNVALDKPATQSSISSWSRGANVEADAANAVNGHPWEPDGFHTDNEHHPWWMVDLGELVSIRRIRIFNRDGQPDWIQRRASPLLVEGSPDQASWTTLFRTPDGFLFGGYSSGSPLDWAAGENVEARFVRVTVERPDALHLSEVEVYGEPAPAEILAGKVPAT